MSDPVDTHAESEPGPEGPESDTHPILRLYLERVTRFTAQAEKLGARSRLVSNLRGLSFGVAVICTIGALVSEHPAPWAWPAFIAAVVFFVFVSRHGRVIQAEDMALRWVHVNKDAITRNGPQFKELSEDGARLSNPLHPYADDLDLFGPASLFQKINTARTHFGQQRLGSFLMNRATRDEIRARQEAARELAAQLDLRQELEALALAVVDPLAGVERGAVRSTSLDTEPLLAWAEGKPGLSNKPSFVVLAWGLPILTVSVIVAAQVFDWPSASWIALLILQAILILSVRVHTASVFSAVSSNQGLFLRFGPMLRVIETLEARAARLQELKQEITSSDGVPPSQAMREFERIVSYFELRHNGLAHIWVNGVLMWDVHCVLRLEAWQRRSGKRLRQWFRALGEFEALASLAAFAHDNPEFAWPEIVEGESEFHARDLGHPLLSRASRVANDVDLGGPTKALLVTGSNMSGKSTLLRAIGVNAVLALAGAPVCARELRMLPFAVRTSMRIRDSLDQGVSHFYAELRRLEGVLSALRGGAPVLFLLDEILHGTNSRERQIGARWVLGELLRSGAIGAVSTHDSGLCELPPPLMAQVRQVHLRELAEATELTFDYKLREGPVKSGNALRLMRAIGIGVPLEAEEGIGPSAPM